MWTSSLSVRGDDLPQFHLQPQQMVQLVNNTVKAKLASSDYGAQQIHCTDNCVFYTGPSKHHPDGWPSVNVSYSRHKASSCWPWPWTPWLDLPALFLGMCESYLGWPSVCRYQFQRRWWSLCSPLSPQVNMFNLMSNCCTWFSKIMEPIR